MKTNHTPGPWTIKPLGVNAVIQKSTANIAIVLPHHVGLLEYKANTTLMATSPEMLEVLETIENDSNQVPEWLWLRIKGVIKKAKEQ